MVEILQISDMTRSVTERGLSGEFLAFDLRELLALTTAEACNLHWAVVPMAEQTFITAKDSPRSEEVDLLNDRVDDNPNGVRYEGKDLLDLSASIQQTIWGTYLGFRNASNGEDISALFQDQWRYISRGTDLFYETVELAFQGVDSSFWLVYAKDETVRQRIAGHFTAVKRLPGPSARL